MANTGIAPPDLDSDVGKFRLLLGDTDATDISAGSGTYAWYSDSEVTALIGIKGSVERAAVFALRQIASSQALMLKKWSSADLTVDGPAIANSLRALAKDIESGLTADDLLAAADFAAIVPTGAAVSQPYFYPGAEGVDLDPTLPVRLV